MAFLPHDVQDDKYDKCVALSPWYQQKNPTNSSLQLEPYIAFPCHFCTFLVYLTAVLFETADAEETMATMVFQGFWRAP